jgi:hypothetical protein
VVCVRRWLGSRVRGNNDDKRRLRGLRSRLLRRLRTWLYVWNLGVMPAFVLALLLAMHLANA